MKYSKILIYYLLSITVLCVNCSTNGIYKVFNRFQFDGSMRYNNYYVLYFKDSQESTIYVLSKLSTEQFSSNDSLVKNKVYDLELVLIEKGTQLEPWGQPIGLLGDDNENLISGDSIVGLMYTSPNIIGKCYAKWNRNE